MPKSVQVFPVLALVAVFLVPPVSVVAGSSARPGEMGLPVQAFLCDTQAHAIQFADIRAGGDTEEIAKDRVGRQAGGEVCGLYRGIAAVQSEAVSMQSGIAYKVTAYRFREDKRVAWLAERSFAPVHAQWDL